MALLIPAQLFDQVGDIGGVQGFKKLPDEDGVTIGDRADQLHQHALRQVHAGRHIITVQLFNRLRHGASRLSEGGVRVQTTR